VVLIWVYYSSQIVLMGAEFTNVYARRYGSLRRTLSSMQNRNDWSTCILAWSSDADQRRKYLIW